MEGEGAAPQPGEGRGCRRPGRALKGGRSLRVGPRLRSRGGCLVSSSSPRLARAVLVWVPAAGSGGRSVSNRSLKKEGDAAAETTPGKRSRERGGVPEARALPWGQILRMHWVGMTGEQGYK